MAAATTATTTTTTKMKHQQQHQQPKEKRTLASLSSLLSMTFVLVLLTGVVTWHGNVVTQQTNAGKPNALTRRWLQSGDDGPDLNDDQTRTEKCKEYLYNFLNGTTDANDQCQGFYNAYKAADCQHDTHYSILSSSSSSSSSSPTLQQQQQLAEDDNNNNNKKNNTTGDDDVLIDDFFENWECCDSIENFYEKNCENGNESLHSIRLLGIMLVLLVCTILKAMLKRMQVHWLPDACTFILVGAFVGGILRIFDQGLVQNKLSFDNDLFLQILLPPIIFQAALSIDKRAFRRDLFPIFAFAGLGTAFSAIAIGVITHHVSKWGNGGQQHLPLLDSLVFGALISSIDPVATLSILSGVGVSQTDTLYTLIFGESLLNDGVAIVLFDTLKSHLGEDDDFLGPDAYKAMARNFFAVLFGSIGIGIAMGFACTVYFYCLRGRQTAVTEVMIFFCWALIPYYVADGTGCSGIIAIMVMGFIMDYFVIGGFQSDETAWMDYMATRNGDQQQGTNNNNNYNNNNGMQHGPRPPMDRMGQLQDSLCKAFSGRGHILSRSRHHVGFVAQVIASAMDTAIFAYLGLFLFNGNDVWSMRLNMTSILSCVSSRAVMVVALSLLINIAVFFDVENLLARLFRTCRRGLNIDDYHTNNNDDNESISSDSRVYLDRKTQLILLLAGVRGAVSFALVENIPVWDTVQQSGSKYKAELKAMTSSAIVFTLFVFGALTYITVKRGSDPSGSGHVVGNLTHRLLSEPLDSDDEAQSEMTSSVLEIEGQGTRPHHNNNNNNVMMNNINIHHDNTSFNPMQQEHRQVPVPEPYRAPEPPSQTQQQQQQYSPISNEWTE